MGKKFRILAVILGFGVTFFMSRSVSADDVDLDINVDTSVSLTTSTDNVQIELPLSGEIHTGFVTAYVTTNNPNGYTLAFNGSGSNPTGLASESDPSETMASITSDVALTLSDITSTYPGSATSDDFPSKSWGYSAYRSAFDPTKTSLTFSAIPSSATYLNAKMDYAGSDPTTLIFAAKADNAMLSGTYIGQVTFTATSPEDGSVGQLLCEEDGGMWLLDYAAGHKCWVYGNNGSPGTWGTFYTGTGAYNHNADVRDGMCLDGYSAPKITDFDNLVRAYGGTAYNNSYRSGYRESTGAIYSALGLSTSRNFWPSTETSSTHAYLFDVYKTYSISSGYYTKTGKYYLLCYRTF